MVTEIPQQLKEKLTIIEGETKFFSLVPQKPRRFNLLLWVVFIAVLGGLFIALKSKDYFFLLFFFMLAVSQVATYFHEKQLFNMYSSACEIINYYKKREESKT